MKILIIKPSSLGDIVQSLPVAMGLRKAMPEAKIDWFVFHNFAPLLENHPAIDELIVVPRGGWVHPELWRSGFQWTKDIRLRRYHMVLDLQGLLRSGFITWLTGAKRRIGLPNAREGSRFAYTETLAEAKPQACERYLDFLKHLEITPEASSYGLEKCSDVPSPLSNDEIDKGYTVIHPYARWRTKIWPWSYYEKLLADFPERHFVFVGNGDYFPIYGNNFSDLRNKLTMRELCKVIKQAQLVLSMDSGPAHLATAFQRPTLVLFGPTDPDRTAPFLAQTLNHELSCSPCLKRKCSLLDRPMACMRRISPENVAEKIREMEAKKPPTPSLA